MTTWISPGEWTAISTGHAWVLADTASDAGLLRDLWTAASADPAAEAVLGRLLADGLANLNGFAIAEVRSDLVRVIVRHPATVTLESGESTERVSAAEGTTWTDVTREVPDRLVLSADGVVADGLELPLTLGAGSASAMRVEISETQEAPRPAPVTRIDPAPAAAVAAAEAEEEVPTPQPQAANPYLDLLTSSTADRDALVARMNGTEEPSSDAQPEPPDAPARLVDGATADWRDLEGELPAVTAPLDEAPSPQVPSQEPASLIDGVPGMSGGSPLAPPTPIAVSIEPDTDVEKTTTRAHLQQLLGTAGIVGPSVLAVRCANGHNTNPMLPTCRACGGSIPEQTPQEIPRPVLGYIRMPNGDTITVDKGIVLGRAPQVTPGLDQHLVTVNTTSEISRMHAQIALDGWNLVIRDLNTTNGTFLTAPGQSTVQLRGGEDYLVEPGSEIDLADALTLRFEVRG